VNSVTVKEVILLKFNFLKPVRKKLHQKRKCGIQAPFQYSPLFKKIVLILNISGCRRDRSTQLKSKDVTEIYMLTAKDRVKA